MPVLSIQSHVAYGYVGNRSAAFPLELLGFDVWMVNTVQFSNHTGYGSWKGEVFGAAHVDAVFDGIAERGALGSCDAVLSGYLGDPSVVESVLRAVRAVKAANPAALYCCDPVMGDTGPGLYVRPGIPELFADALVPAADIVTPNQFEAELLGGLRIATDADAARACEAIHAKGPGLALITSYLPADREPGTISMFLSEGGRRWRVSTPELSFDPPPNGSGDLVAALLLGWYLRTGDAVEALERMADAVHSVLERTRAEGSRELRLVQSRDELLSPGRRFRAVRVP